MHLLKKTYHFLIAFMIGFPILYFVQFWRVQNQSSEIEPMRVAAVAQMLKYSDNQNTEDLFLNMFDVYLKNGSISYYVIRYEDGRMLYPSSEHALTQESQYRQNSRFEYRTDISIEDKKYYVFFGKDQLPLLDQWTQLLEDQKEVLFVFLLGIFLFINKIAADLLNFNIGNRIPWFKNQVLKEESEIVSVPVVAGRCEINNLNVLKQNASPEFVNYVVQSFLNRGGEYLERYGADKENTSGDEISFYLRPEEMTNAQLKGLHLIRGFFEIFEDLNAEANVVETPLSVKATLNDGPVAITQFREIKGYSKEDLSPEALPYFRTDRDVTLILHDMAHFIQNKDLSKYELLRAHLASLEISRTPKTIATGYQFLIETALRSQNDKILSGVAFLAKILLSVDSITEEILLNLGHCLQSPNKRVVSNARESLYHLKPNLINLQKYIDSHDNRAAADSLIDLVKNEGLTDAYTLKLLGWLNTPSNKNFQLSALYASFKIYEHWLKTKPDYVELNPNFKKLDAVILSFSEKYGADPHFEKWLRRYRHLNLRLQKKAT